MRYVDIPDLRAGARLFREAVHYLRSFGIEDPEPDVRRLAAFAAGLPLRRALDSPPPPLDRAAAARFCALATRRGQQREPVGYVIGAEEFMGLELSVGPAAPLPRRSAEALVRRAGRPGRFLDVGTGSGALAVALAKAGFWGVAVDRSEAALALARENAARHGVAGCIKFAKADLFPMPTAEVAFDVVVSRPPCATSAEWASRPPEARHEPREAVDGGPDGLRVIRRLVAGARAQAPRLLLTCAPQQRAPVRSLAHEAGFKTVRAAADAENHGWILEAA
jgi:release factor glutamine methyltransferase